MDFSSVLNEQQFRAVTTSSQNTRVIAGAGSGKTRVLTYRVAYLISELNVNPYNILAISFTNKATGEMYNRLNNLLEGKAQNLTVKTFHAFATYFLRREIDVLGYPQNFTILDDEDQTNIVKEIASESGYKKSDPIVGRTLAFIDSCKLKEKYPEDVSISSFKNNQKEMEELLDFYERYEARKNRQFSLDFDDLLLKSIQILSNYPEIQAKWQARYSYILVDEFQDTNDVEYHFLNLLLNSDTSLYVVGDPDQTIYTWRGTNARIIVDLDKKIKGLVTIVLDKNYRSTQYIIDAANKLISHNKLRVEKKLSTVNGLGSRVVVKSNNTRRSEAEWLCREILDLVEKHDFSYRDIAVLYRSSYVTVDFEQVLAAYNIPYRIYGSLKFFSRREVKDALAFFKLVNEPRDDLSFERIINIPKRGIGDATVEQLRKESYNSSTFMYLYIKELDESDSIIPNKHIQSLKTLIARIDEARNEVKKGDEPFAKILEDLIMDIGYYEYLKNDEDFDDRMENIKSLFNDMRTYQHENPEATLDEYLQNIALQTSQDELKDNNYVSLMTVHTAKGLEYRGVFVVRFNESVFPHTKSVSERGYEALEEERRLAYVAFTRAKEKLFISYSCDYSYVSGGNLIPSRFIKESGLIEPASSYNQFGTFASNNSRKPKENAYSFNDTPAGSEDSSGYYSQVEENNNITWEVGDKVLHDTLGEGVVVSIEGDGIIKVEFKDHGLKSILSNHPKVKKG
ncbi:MAG: UvrD-helicase domain-containing protein [Coprobacillus sp.]|nr:UvrD-helicase domain-containing protein [Coprobacillus sp.]